MTGTTRSLAHQCHACRRPWALEAVVHPAGTVVRCRYCSAVRAVSRVRSPGLVRQA